MTMVVVADAGEYHVTVCTPQAVDPDHVRLYRNRTRVLVAAEGDARYGADLTLHASDMLEAAMADGSKVELVTVRRPAPAAGTPIKETVTFTGEASKPAKKDDETRPLRG